MSLAVEGLVVGYGKLDVLHEIAFEAPAGQCVAVVGPNGAGKSTLLGAIAGLLPIRAGSVSFEGESIAGRPTHELAARGIALVPEGRHLFSTLSVRENLEVARRLGAGRKSDFGVTDAFRMFPVLEERRSITAERLSGGEQQMLAIARALMLAPRLIMLDEPSIGLAPVVVSRVMDVARSLVSEKTAVLLVEQNIVEARRIADYSYVLDQGRITRSGRAAEVLDQTELRREYLGA